MKKIAALVTLLISLILPSSAFAATLSLSPNSGNINPGCTFTSNVLLDTAGAKVDGVDVILMYDPSRLTATITNGTIFPSYPLSNVDPTNAKISVSGVASVGTPYTNQAGSPGTFATINFTVAPQAPTGVTNVNFDYVPNTTTHSNVIEDGTTNQLLNGVTSASFVIGSGNCNSQTLKTVATPGIGGVSTPSATTTSTASAIPLKTLPVAGSGDLTVQLAIFGGVLTTLGVIGLALL